jgi:hypothetical protein
MRKTLGRTHPAPLGGEEVPVSREPAEVCPRASSACCTVTPEGTSTVSPLTVTGTVPSGSVTSIRIASSGQAETQAPHPVQSSILRDTARGYGTRVSQISQCTHRSGSLTALRPVHVPGAGDL